MILSIKFSFKKIIIVSAFLSNVLLLRAAVKPLDKGKDHAETSTSLLSANHITIEAIEEEIISLSGFTKKIKKYSEMRKILNYELHEISMKLRSESLLSPFKTNPIIPFDVLDELLYQCIKKFNDTIGLLCQPSDLPFYPEVCEERKVLPARDNDICVIGDIHGSVHSLVKILNDLKAKGYLDDYFKIIRDEFYMVFTGDYVDRGLFGTEVWYLLLKLKLTNWDKVFLLQGNHEDVDLNFTAGSYCSQNEACSWGFYAEIAAKYGKDGLEWFERWTGSFFRLYGYLPQKLTLRPGADAKRLVFCHAGFPDGYSSYDDDRKVSLGKGHSVYFLTCHTLSYEDRVIRLDYFWHDYFVAANSSLGKEPTMVLMNRKVLLNKAFDQTINDHGYIDAVRQEYTKKDLIETKNIGGIFRGHQHCGAGLKIWNENQLKDWNTVESFSKKTSFLISEIDCPIFTFTTATEFGISTDVLYGLIKVGPDYTKWTLTPCLIEREN